MKLFYSLMLLLVLIGSYSCKPATVIYLVRHAEKVDDSRDPDLSDAGKARAEQLSSLLQNEKIVSIYSTKYKRTIQTATPLSNKTNVPIQFYTPDSLSALAKNIRMLNKNTLVVGHSNTTINLLEAFGLQFSKKKIEDSDYKNLFKITQTSPSSKLKLEELTY